MTIEQVLSAFIIERTGFLFCFVLEQKIYLFIYYFKTINLFI